MIPVGFVGERLVYAVVEIFVVGEDDMATDIIELDRGASVGVTGQLQK